MRAKHRHECRCGSDESLRHRMFSSRLPERIETNRLARVIERTGVRLDLTISNPTSAGIKYDIEAITAALADPRALNYEPTPWGLLAAREAVAQYTGAS